MLITNNTANVYPTGGGTQDAQARTAIVAILDALEAVGILKAS